MLKTCFLPQVPVWSCSALSCAPPGTTLSFFIVRLQKGMTLQMRGAMVQWLAHIKGQGHLMSYHFKDLSLHRLPFGQES